MNSALKIPGVIYLFTCLLVDSGDDNYRTKQWSQHRIPTFLSMNFDFSSKSFSHSNICFSNCGFLKLSFSDSATNQTIEPTSQYSLNLTIMQKLMELQKQNGCLSCLIYEARTQCFEPDLILAKNFDGKITVLSILCYRDLLVL